MTITVGPTSPGGTGAGGWPQLAAGFADDETPIPADVAAATPQAEAPPASSAPAGFPPLDPRLVQNLHLAAGALQTTPGPSAEELAQYHAALAAMLGALPPPGGPQGPALQPASPPEPPTTPPTPPADLARADPAELAVADLLRLDPGLQALLGPFATQAAAVPDTALGRQILALYGPERATDLHRLAGASAEVRQQFVAAMDTALRSSPLGPATLPTGTVGQHAADGHLAPAGLSPWWRLTHHGDPVDGAHTLATFDPAAFVTWYTAQDHPAARAFTELYGPEVVCLSRTQTGPEGDHWEIVHHLVGSGRFELLIGHSESIEHQATRWVPSTLGTPWADGLAVLDPARPVELFQPELIRFDPAMGFVTPASNIVPEDDWVDQALVLAAAAAAGWFGAQVIAPAMGGSLGSAAAAGAAASAVGSLVATGSIHLKDVLHGALSSLVTAGLSQAAGLDTLGYQLDDAGRVVLEGGRPVIASYTLRSMAVLGTASVKGLVTELAGGRFRDGFSQGLALELAHGLAGELVRELDAQVAAGLKDGTFGPGEASVLQTLGRAVGAAVRVAATPGDPAAALAAELLQTLGQAIGEDIVLAMDAQALSPVGTAPFIVPPALPTSGQAAQGLLGLADDRFEQLVRSMAQAGDEAGLQALAALMQGEAQRATATAGTGAVVMAQEQYLLMLQRSGQVHQALQGSALGGVPGLQPPDPTDPLWQGVPASPGVTLDWRDLVNTRPTDWPDWAQRLLVRAQLSAQELMRYAPGTALPVVITSWADYLLESRSTDHQVFTPSRTHPTGQLGGQAVGDRTVSLPNADADNKDDIRAENEALDVMANAGYRTERNPVLTPEERATQGIKPGKNPDARIEGRVFDVKASDTPAAAQTAIRDSLGKGQAHRFVINAIHFPDPDAGARELAERLRMEAMPGLQEVKIIVNGVVRNIYP